MKLRLSKSEPFLFLVCVRMLDLSIIMPVKNGEKYIQEAFRSIEKQSLKGVSLTIIDDASEDRSLEYCEAFARSNILPVTILHSSALGPAGARNKGITASTSEWITFLDQDDWWPDNRLQVHQALFEKDPAIDIVVGKINIFTANAESLKRFRFPDNDHTLYNVNLGASTFRRTVFERVGCLDERLHYSEDQDLFFRVREAGLNLHYTSEVALNYRLHCDNMTKDKGARELGLFSVLRQSLLRRKKGKIANFANKDVEK